MSELNREELIKALEWCIDEGDCEKCPIGDVSSCHIETKSLALIKELTEENEKLTNDNRWCAKRILEADRIINELRKNTDEIAKTLPMAKKEIQADTVRQIQLKMAMHYGTYTDKDMTPITEVFRVLDQIAKEMLEG